MFLATENFQEEHGAPRGEIEIVMTRTHHTMRAGISEVATMIFRMVVLVTDRDNIIDYETIESADEIANVGSGDDADNSQDDAAESSGDDQSSRFSQDDNSASNQSSRFSEEINSASDEDEVVSISEDEDSQPRGPCSMCGVIGLSGQKCETGPDCDSDTRGVYA